MNYWQSSKSVATKIFFFDNYVFKSHLLDIVIYFGDEKKLANIRSNNKYGGPFIVPKSNFLIVIKRTLPYAIRKDTSYGSWKSSAFHRST